MPPALQLIVMLKSKCFTDGNSDQPKNPLPTINDFNGTLESDILKIEDLKLTEEELESYVDLRPAMNPYPFSVNVGTPLTRVYRL